MRQRRLAREVRFVLLVVATLVCAGLIGSPSVLDAGRSKITVKTGGAQSMTALVFGGGLRPSFVRLQPSPTVLHADLGAGDLHVISLGFSPVSMLAHGGPGGAVISLSATGLAVHLEGDDGAPSRVRTGLRLW